jgi:hypothetical protein
MKKYIFLGSFIFSGIAAMVPTTQQGIMREIPTFDISPKQQQALEYSNLKKN